MRYENRPEKYRPNLPVRKKLEVRLAGAIYLLNWRDIQESHEVIEGGERGEEEEGGRGLGGTIK